MLLNIPETQTDKGSTMPQHSMRRKDRQISPEKSRDLLEQGEYLVLAVTDTDGLPYAVPLSYAVMNGLIYVHCAHEGKKIDALRHGNRVWLVVVGAVRAVYENNFSTFYESVMVDGTAQEVTGVEEKIAALTALAQKYLPEHLDKADVHIRKSLARTAVYAVTPLAVTGKAKKKNM